MHQALVTILSVIDYIIFFVFACNVVYLLYFSICSLRKSKITRKTSGKKTRFAIVFPAYAEDNVIISSVASAINQDYDKESYHVYVISDHMKEETDAELEKLGATCLKATYDNSSKAKALQLAIATIDSNAFDNIVILDADNQVDSDFLSKLNDICDDGIISIQCHRTSRKSSTDVQQLDSISEEINNSIFRRGHVNSRLSSALIGSGMCFKYEWFAENVGHLSTAGEDKELEKLLIQDNIKTLYAEHINVYDLKTAKSDNFQRQRKRWMAAQVYSLKQMLRDIAPEMKKGNIDYLDKTIQQALIPRSMCIVGIVISTLVVTIVNLEAGIKWMILTSMFFLSLGIAVPRRFYNASTLRSALSIPKLVILMIANLLHLKGVNDKFIHTKH